MSYAPNSRHAEAPPSKIPAVLLRAIVAVVLFTLALTIGARILGLEPAATPDDTVGIVQERSIVVDGVLGGAALVTDGETGAVIADLDATEAGFINGVMTALGRERMLHKIEGNPPVRIVQFADGRLGLRDPATGWRVELMGFGDDNRDAFLALLD